MTKSPTSRVSSPTSEKTDTKMETVKIKRTYKPRAHPLDPFVYTDDVPVTTYDSPLSNHSFFTGDKTTEAQRMERKIRGHCYDFNTPCKGSAIERTALGECSEEVFDTYMSSTMPSHLYRRKEEHSPYSGRDGSYSTTNIIYEFNYPHFPSFGNPDWTKYYNTIDMEEVAEDLETLGGEIPEYFREAQYRSIGKKLCIILDTCTEVYYVRLVNWVQKKCDSDISECGFAWINSF